MIVQFGNKRTLLIGDPHLGRRFVTGVPKHRLGEREINVTQDFINRLGTPNVDMAIVMGDLFDSYVVPMETIASAADASRASKIPAKIFMAGNHDKSRDLLRVSAFDIFTKIVHYRDRCCVVADGVHVEYVDNNQGVILIFGWDAFHPASEQALKAVDWWKLNNKPKVYACLGHWDVIAYENTSNLIPTKILSEITDTIYIGHVHQKGSFTRDNVNVIQVGSMQPYAHGEGDMYVTLTLDEVRQLDPISLKDKCVRVVLQEGEELPTDLDALQIIRGYPGEVEMEKDVSTPEEVRIESFDLQRLMTESFDAKKVPDDIREKISTKFKENEQ